MQRLARVLIILGVIAGLLVGMQRFAVERDFLTVESVVDLDDLMAHVGAENVHDVLMEVQHWDIDGVVITVSSLREWTADDLREQAQAIKDAGYQVILRVGGDEEEAQPQGYLSGGNPGMLDRNWSGDELATLVALVEPQVLMFGGRQVTGYPDDTELIAALLRGTDTRFGLQEFAHQLGETELAELLPLHTVRVHTIYPRELPRYDAESAKTRYLRAVRERSYRLLYVRLWPEKPLANKDLIDQLGPCLSGAGYSRGPAASLPPWQSSMAGFVMAVGGWLGAGIILCSCLSGVAQWRWERWGLLLLLGVAVAALGLYSFYDELLARQIAAFLAAITFPTWAVFPQRWASAPQAPGRDVLPGKGDRLPSGSAARWSAIRYAMKEFGKTVGVSLAGVAVMVAALGDFRFMLKIAQFRGVKVMSLLPLLIVGAAAMLYSLSLEKPLRIRHRWRRMSRWSRVLVTFFALVFVVIYVGRTGNFIIPVTELEVRLRESLEEFVTFRPRTKEFLIGHPLLVVGFGLYRWGWQRTGLVCTVFGTIGQISLLNTFTHAHSPLVASIHRTVWGLLIGVVLGFSLLGVILSTVDSHKDINHQPSVKG